MSSPPSTPSNATTDVSTSATSEATATVCQECTAEDHGRFCSNVIKVVFLQNLTEIIFFQRPFAMRPIHQVRTLRCQRFQGRLEPLRLQKPQDLRKR